MFCTDHCRCRFTKKNGDDFKKSHILDNLQKANPYFHPGRGDRIQTTIS
ncbi:hypothetical protein LAQ65_00020 [Flavihumibacter profundi]|nr:hypothetical protein [Flavihumibacter profundi]